MNAFLALYHNGCLIRKAEHILREAAQNPNCYIYLENPDGTRVRIQPGCKIIDFEYALTHNEGDCIGNEV